MGTGWQNAALYLACLPRFISWDTEPHLCPEAAAGAPTGHGAGHLAYSAAKGNSPQAPGLDRKGQQRWLRSVTPYFSC